MEGQNVELKILITSWTPYFYDEVGFRHLAGSKGAIGSQVEEKGADLESHGVVCEHDWKKLRLAKIKEKNNKFIFHWDVVEWVGVHKGHWKSWTFGKKHLGNKSRHAHEFGGGWSHALKIYIP